MSSADVSVVVPAFNNCALTRRCIETLLTVTSANVIADTIVVDDGSNDGESAAWAAAGRSFRPVLLSRNQGFSRACNAGAAASRGEFVLFLNNDAFVSADAVAAMRAAFNDPTIGIAGAKLVYGDGTLQHAGLALLAGPVSRWWHVHRRLPATLEDANVRRDFLAVTGAALMIRRSVFDALGGFDTRYTNGWEDVDLCLRTWCLGLRVLYEPRAVIKHLESATLGRKHDDRDNEQSFIGRWSEHLTDAPRYPLGEIPPLAVAVQPGGMQAERTACEHYARAWARDFGASVRFTRAGSRFDRLKVEFAAALAKRQPVLEVAWQAATFVQATGTQRVAFVAPCNAVEASAFAAVANVGAWWTPTVQSRDALAAAGLPHERISVIPPGATIGAAPPLRSGSITIAAAESDADVLASIASRTPDITTRLLADGPPDFAAVDIYVARNGGDRYGLLIPAALAAGCHVVASAPLDTELAAMPGMHVVGAMQLALAAGAIAGRPAALRSAASEIYLAARRQLDAALATQHAAEAARAVVHGTPSSAVAAVDAAFAARLRDRPVKT